MGESRLIFIINTRSGGGQGKHVIQALRRYACGSDPKVVIEELAFDTSANQCADITPEDTVVIGGGDGTISRMVDVLRGRGCRVGLLPLGTGNDLARELGVFARVRGASPEQLFSFYRAAPARPVSVFTLRYGTEDSSAVSFINYVSIGFDAKVVSEFARRRHGPPWSHFQGVWTNRFAYGLLCLRFWNYRLDKMVTVEGGGTRYQVGNARSLLFTNIRSIMGLGVSNERSDPGDERIECLVVERMQNYLAMVMPRTKYLSLPPVLGAESCWTIWSAKHPLPIQVDGEARPEISASTFSIEVAGSLRIVVGDELATNQGVREAG